MEDNNILNLEGRTRLSADITLLMLKGAGYAAAAILVIWLSIAVLAAIGTALPEESRDTPDPINRSSIELLIEPTVNVG